MDVKENSYFWISGAWLWLLISMQLCKVFNKFTRSRTSKDNCECKQVFKVPNILNATIITPNLNLKCANYIIIAEVLITSRHLLDGIKSFWLADGCDFRSTSQETFGVLDGRSRISDWT